MISSEQPTIAMNEILDSRTILATVPVNSPGFEVLLAEVLSDPAADFGYRIQIENAAVDPQDPYHTERREDQLTILADSPENVDRIKAIHKTLIEKNDIPLPSALVDDALHGVVSNITSLLDGDSDRYPLPEEEMEALMLAAINRKLNPAHGNIKWATAVPVIGVSLKDFKARRVELEGRKVTPMGEERMRAIVAKDVEWILEARPDLKPISPLRLPYLSAE